MMKENELYHGGARQLHYNIDTCTLPEADGTKKKKTRSCSVKRSKQEPRLGILIHST